MKEFMNEAHNTRGVHRAAAEEALSSATPPLAGPITTREIADKLFQLANLLEAEGLRAAVFNPEGSSVLEQQAAETREMARRLWEMKRTIGE